jgi:RNA polymerase sigma-70 factor (ECF subfamily)
VEQNSIASLMGAFRDGDSDAGAKLMDLLYPELKRIAANQLKGERPGHSWQPTLLVNELYLEIIKIKALRPAQTAATDDKAAFLALAGLIMKRLLIHHARPISHKAQKVPVWEDLLTESNESLIEVEDVLTRLGTIKPIIRTVVELKVFEGKTAEEIAGQLGCAPVTVHRYWQFARQWMKTEWTK